MKTLFTLSLRESRRSLQNSVPERALELCINIVRELQAVLSDASRNILTKLTATCTHLDYLEYLLSFFPPRRAHVPDPRRLAAVSQCLSLSLVLSSPPHAEQVAQHNPSEVRRQRHGKRRKVRKLICILSSLSETHNSARAVVAEIGPILGVVIEVIETVELGRSLVVVQIIRPHRCGLRQVAAP